MLVIRIGTVAFSMTGLSEEVARFQSLSAFSGTGFTTDEAETIVTNPARRRIAALLIRLGAIGVVSSVATLLLSFVGAGEATPERLLVLGLGIFALLALARSRAFNSVLTPLIGRLLARYTSLEVRDYADLLHLREDYRIVELDIRKHTWLADRPLGDLDLAAEGVLVIGVVRTGEDYVGVPPADLRLRPRERLVLYGRKHRLHELATRAAGNQVTQREARAEHARPDRAAEAAGTNRRGITLTRSSSPRCAGVPTRLARRRSRGQIPSMCERVTRRAASRGRRITKRFAKVFRRHRQWNRTKSANNRCARARSRANLDGGSLRLGCMGFRGSQVQILSSRLSQTKALTAFMLLGLSLSGGGGITLG